ncbi:MAG: hypothetical protein LC117_02615 [Bacteroidia bacterium]|nr:hypothetical protein [Bacteroidia bacterium]
MIEFVQSDVYQKQDIQFLIRQICRSYSNYLVIKITLNAKRGVATRFDIEKLSRFLKFAQMTYRLRLPVNIKAEVKSHLRIQYLNYDS